MCNQKLHLLEQGEDQQEVHLQQQEEGLQLVEEHLLIEVGEHQWVVDKLLVVLDLEAQQLSYQLKNL